MQYNDIKFGGKDVRVKRSLTRMDEISRYIDICLIDEYADKDFENGYTLDIDSVPEHDRSNFLDLLMKHDTGVRDHVLYAMQQMIDARLPECEVSDRDAAGLRLVQMSNGDTRIERYRDYYDE